MKKSVPSVREGNLFKKKLFPRMPPFQKLSKLSLVKMLLHFYEGWKRVQGDLKFAVEAKGLS